MLTSHALVLAKNSSVERQNMYSPRICPSTSEVPATVRDEISTYPMSRLMFDRCGAVKCGEGDAARHGTARHGTARHGTARHGTARHGAVRMCVN